MEGVEVMNTHLLSPNKDPMGYAIADYHAKGKAGKLRVFSSQFEEDEIPVAQLFRTFDEIQFRRNKSEEEETVAPTETVEAPAPEQNNE